MFISPQLELYISRKRGILNVLQPYRFPRSATGIASLSFYFRTIQASTVVVERTVVCSVFIADPF
jgi:hypothetical protein